jgi:photosystem II stability/assembly factor-like uncharacterized protein
MKHFFKPFFIVALFLLVGQGCIGVSTGGDGVQTSGPAGMFITTNKGEEWQPIVAYPTADGVQNLSSVSVYKIIPDSHDLQTLYWLSRSNGMFYTTDDGKSWQRVKGPLATGFVYDLAIHPTDPCTMYGTNGTFIYKSEDCARSWEEVYRESRAEVGIRTIEFHKFAPFQIVVGSSNGDLLISNDFGDSWSVSMRLGSAIAEIMADPLQAGRLYMTTQNNGLHRTEDGGHTWVSLAGNLGKYPQALEYSRAMLHPTKSGVLYWVSTYGVLVSEDAGESWNPLSLITPPGSVQIYGFGINPQNDSDIYYTATINGRSTFYRSIDGGQSWITRRLPTGQIPTALHAHGVNDSWVYLGFTIPPSS